MRLLIIANEEFPTNRPMLSELWNREFTQRGHSIVWILLSSEPARYLRNTTWGMNTVYMLPSFGKSSVSKIINRCVGFVALFFLIPYIVITKKIDLVHFHNAVTPGIIWLIFRPFFRLRSSFAYTFPFYLLSRREGFIRSVRKTIYKKMLHLVLYHVSLIMPISSYFRDIFLKELMISPGNFLPVSESASSLFLNYQSSEKQSVSLAQRFIYVGEISIQRQLTTIIDAFDIVFKKYRNVELILIGWGIDSTDVPSLKKYASGLPSSGAIRFMNKIKYQNVPEIVTTCIAGLSPIPPVELYLISTPTKCIEYVSLGVPVIANKEIYDQNEFVTQSGGGILVNYSSSAFAEAMIYVVEHSEEARQMGKCGRNWLQNNRSFSLLAETIEIRYNSLKK